MAYGLGDSTRVEGDDARSRYLAALAYAEVHDAAVPRATFAMDLDATELASGRLDAARLLLSRAERDTEGLAPGSVRSLLTPLVAHYRALLRLAAQAFRIADRSANDSLRNDPAAAAAPISALASRCAASSRRWCARPRRAKR